ncbi:MAG: formylglycine-generating enzyme family protein [Isosphaeraceae bacterium]
MSTRSPAAGRRTTASGPTPVPTEPSSANIRSALRLILLGTLAFSGTYLATRNRTETVVATSPSSRPKDTNAAPGPRPEGMVWIPAGEFTMGSTDPLAWPDEGPPHRVSVDGFWMDAHEVTNDEFRRFVDATGYVTTAERPPDAAEILGQSPPGTPPPAKELLVPGSLVFTPPASPVALDDISRWWTWTPGACWRHPEGPGSTLEGRGDHPVVQVSWDDATAYARWAGKRLPSEAEWERAARGGSDGHPFVWGDVPASDASIRANIWQGHFPDRNSAQDGYPRTAPVGSFAANAFGLHDMAGNVWEWCADWYDRTLYESRAGQGVVKNPVGPTASRDPRQPFTPQRVQRGGSFLCNDNYCARYRPSARHGCAPDTGMSHVGFRCVRNP